MLPEFYINRQSRPDHFSSIKVSGDRTLIAACPGRGIYRKKDGEEWSALQQGLPEGTAVNRLQMSDGRVYACTSRGLYALEADSWISSEVGRPCYQYKEEWGYGFAATGSGLLYKASGDWKESAFENSIVYDFLFTPQYMYIGLDRGISMYDRLTDRWAAFELGFGVTSLACTRDHLFGSGERGELVWSDGKGGFDTVSFGELFIFSVATWHSRVYVCTDRGLYRIGRLGSAADPVLGQARRAGDRHRLARNGAVHGDLVQRSPDGGDRILAQSLKAVPAGPDHPGLAAFSPMHKIGLRFRESLVGGSAAGRSFFMQLR